MAPARRAPAGFFMSAAPVNWVAGTRVEDATTTEAVVVGTATGVTTTAVAVEATDPVPEAQPGQ